MTVPYYEYETEKFNKKIEKDMIAYIKDTLSDRLSFIPITDEDDSDGCSCETKIIVKKCK